MIRINDIIDRVQSYYAEADVEPIRKAYVFSAKVHEGQTRMSGESYMTHPMEVASILAGLKLDVPTISTGLLHDTVEDTKTTLDEIEDIFGIEIKDLVDGVTKISKVSFSSDEEQQAENFRKMLIAMAKDIRVILIKLADRMHNMRTLQFVPEAKQKRISQETLDIYAPLANRLGIQSIKLELEDLAFKYLSTDVYSKLARETLRKEKERKGYIDDVKEILQKKLREIGIRAEVTGRTKNIYSIHRKMQEQQIEFDQIYDLIAFRMIVKDVRDCYTALGIIHSEWKPVPGRFKDFIGVPKPNMYQSLHTTVLGPFGERLEIQIRTEDMHRIAESGIAAHWRYKESGKVLTEKDGERFAWLRQLMDWQRDQKDPTEFLKGVKVDLFPEEVYAFTPKGEVRAFPLGSTPVDYAYRIHTDVGHQCTHAKVNGKLVPLKYQLRTGDVVEIVTTKGNEPSKDWLDIVVTSTARTKIKNWIRKQESQESQALGGQICKKGLKKYGLNFDRLIKSGDLKNVAKKLKYKELNDMLSAVAFGNLSVRAIVENLLPEEKLKEQSEAEEVSRVEKLLTKITKRPPSAIRIGDVDNLMVRYAKCCDPIPGDGIVGFITRGRGLTVHRVNCSKVGELEPERKVEVFWDQKTKATRLVRIKITCQDRPGLLVALSQAISAHEVNISSARMWATRDHQAIGKFQVEVRDLDQLKTVVKSIDRVKGVLSVERLQA